jgi:hypothetical protein
MKLGSSRQTGFVHLPAILRPDAALSGLRSLRVFMLSCVAVALLLFTAFAWYRHGQMHDQAQVRLQRTLAIAHEHALRVLDTKDTLLRYTLALVNDDDDSRVLVGRAALHRQLLEMSQGKPQIQSICVQGADGKPLVSNRSPEPPATFDISDRPYFAWHKDKRGGVFPSGVMAGDSCRAASTASHWCRRCASATRS